MIILSLMKFQLKYHYLIIIQIIGIAGQAQMQLGGDLIGGSPNQGYSVSMSSDGSLVAVGDIEKSDQLPSAGQVRVYKFNDDNWVQLGAGMNGSEAHDWFGFSVALSDDGGRLIACAYNSPFVKVFEYQSNTWKQMGNSIHAGLGSIETEDVAISAKGDIIAVGAAEFPQAVIHRGVARVYRYLDSDWKQLGSDIIGEHEKDQSGWSVSLSGDGTVLAIGAINNSDGGDHAGHVRIYKFADGNWIKLGNDIDGKGEGYYFGWTLSLSTDGNRIAIGGFRGFHDGDNTGYVGIYEFNLGAWELVGQEIVGFENEKLGYKVSLSGEGGRVAVSSPENADCPVRIFDFFNGQWEQVGKSIKTNREFTNTGYSLGLSRDGNRIATTTRLYGGFVQVYDISSVSTEDHIGEDCGKNYKDSIEVSEFKIFPNPTLGELKVIGLSLKELKEKDQLLLFDILGREIVRYEIIENTIDLNCIPAGIYFLKLADRIEKIIKIDL